MTDDSLEPLVGRVRKALTTARVSEKRMFGGVTFMLNGNMLCTVFEEGLMLRVGKDAEAAALARPFATEPEAQDVGFRVRRTERSG
jgi:TfoX/Sxy family transcriptional regulator of competence genes